MTKQEFTALVQTYQGLVYTVCHQLVPDGDAAEDLAQETFLAAWRAADRCPPGFEKQWLARIAANKAKDYLRSAYQRRVIADGGDSMESLPARGSPEELCDTADGVRRIREEIDRLGEPYTIVSRMYFLEEKKLDEISAQLSRPKKTVQTQIYRARQMLREALKEDGYGT